MMLKPSSINEKSQVLTYSPSTQYDLKVLRTAPIAYWKLVETTGTVINDTSGNGFDGTYNANVILNATTFLDGSPAPSFNGVNAVGDVFGAGLAALFSANVGSLQAWCKINSLAVWNDGVSRFPVQMRGASSANLIRFTKITNTLSVRATYTGNSVSVSATKSGYTSLNWFNLTCTWSIPLGRLRLYLNGEFVTENSLATIWNSALAQFFIGAADAAGTSDWSGNLSRVALWNTELTAQQIASLAVVVP